MTNYVKNLRTTELETAQYDVANIIEFEIWNGMVPGFGWWVLMEGMDVRYG